MHHVAHDHANRGPAPHRLLPVGARIRTGARSDIALRQAAGLCAADRRTEEAASTPTSPRRRPTTIATTGSADAAIWLGRRLAYLGRFRDAIDVFTAGIARHPGEPRLYRHRGHRYITIEEVRSRRRRPDGGLRSWWPGGPTRSNLTAPRIVPAIPRSTLQSNIWYHLGLAHYLNAAISSRRSTPTVRA